MEGLYELMVYSVVLVGLGALLGWGLAAQQNARLRLPTWYSIHDEVDMFMEEVEL